MNLSKKQLEVKNSWNGEAGEKCNIEFIEKGRSQFKGEWFSFSQDNKPTWNFYNLCYRVKLPLKIGLLKRILSKFWIIIIYL